MHARRSPAACKRSARRPPGSPATHVLPWLPLLPPPKQARFLSAYNERATGLSAEMEAARAAHKEAHRAVRLGEGRVQRLAESLAEEQARKEVGVGGRCCWAAAGEAGTLLLCTGVPACWLVVPAKPQPPLPAPHP